MNYTFLPYREQQKIRREYRIRVLIVLFFFISLSFLIGVGSLFPSYIFSVLEERTHLDQVIAFQKTADATTITATQQVLSQSGTVLDTVSNALQSNLSYSVITSIVSLKGNVVLNSFTVEHPSAKEIVVVVSGIAPTRADLLAFNSRLQGLPNKPTVDLPISTLAQDTHASFSIQITESLQ